MLNFIETTFEIILTLIVGYVLWYAFVRITLLAYFNTVNQIKRSKLRRAALAAIDAAQKQHSVHKIN
jgi:hypothetical protein